MDVRLFHCSEKASIMHNIENIIDTNESGDKTEDEESFSNRNGNRIINLDVRAVVNKLRKDDSIKA